MKLVFNLVLGTALGVGLTALLTILFAFILGRKVKPPKPWQVMLLISSYFGVVFLGFAITDALSNAGFTTRLKLDKTALYTWIIVFLLGYMRLWFVDLRRRIPTVGTDLRKGAPLGLEALEGLSKADCVDKTRSSI
jgi:hypothetical protein